MASTAASLQRLQQKALHADQLIILLKSQIQAIQHNAGANACRVQQEKLEAENASLRQEVEQLKARLCSAEIKNGGVQVPLPSASKLSSVTPAGAAVTKEIKTTALPAAAKTLPAVVTSEEKKQPAAGKADAKKETKADKKVESKAPPQSASATPSATDGSTETVDASRLNMRIGFIVSAKKHPDADSLYVEEVDVGESKPRTIVSGLVKHISLEAMQQRYAVFLLNLKPAKMRGVLSEGMIMCASTPEKVEIIDPPAGVAVGDKVTVDGYPGSPDDQLNPKKKIWEQIQPDLRINEQGLATYKGALWRVEGKGTFKAPSLISSPIK